MLEPGVEIDGFRIERLLGQGGMGTVYVATQLSTGRQRALKVLHPTFVQNAPYVERFVTEARVGSRIESEHVVEVVGAGMDRATQTPWIAMELLEGQSLDEMITQRGPLPANEVLSVFEQTCHGLAAAHRAGVVHRDLKPENIFIAHARRVGLPFVVKILDFGIAKLTQEAQTAAGTQAIGTPYWMAPEQTHVAGNIGPHTDLWALGLLAFYALSGRPYWLTAQPGAQSSLPQFINEVLVEPIEPPSHRVRRLGLGVALPPAFDAWFARAVNREPSQRYPSAAQCLEGLKASLSPAHFAATAAIGTMVLDSSALPSNPGWSGGAANIPPAAPVHHPAPHHTPAPVASQPGYGSLPGAASQPGHLGSYPGAVAQAPLPSQPGYGSHPGLTPQPYNFNPPPKSHTGLFVGLGMAALLVLGVAGGLGIYLGMDDDDDETVAGAAAGAAPTDDGFEQALSDCQAAINAQNPALALQHANTALTARPSETRASVCQHQASSLQLEEATYNQGAAELARGDYTHAYATLESLPPTSGYRMRPQLSQAAGQVANVRLSDAQNRLRGDPAAAYLAAQAVTLMRDVSPAHVRQARDVLERARRRAGTVYEGRITSGAQTGGTCSVSVITSRTGNFNCRIRVRCAGRTIYGAGTSGYNHCRRANGELAGANDTGQTHQDGDPEMLFDLPNRRVRVQDRGVDVQLRLVMPAETAAPEGALVPVPVNPR